LIAQELLAVLRGRGVNLLHGWLEIREFGTGDGPGGSAALDSQQGVSSSQACSEGPSGIILISFKVLQQLICELCPLHLEIQRASVMKAIG